MFAQVISTHKGYETSFRCVSALDGGAEEVSSGNHSEQVFCRPHSMGVGRHEGRSLLGTQRPAKLPSGQVHGVTL